MKETQANWNSDQTVLTCVEDFEWPTPHTRTNIFTKCDPALNSRPYWCSIGGQCFALEPSKDTQSCIASVVTALRHSGIPRQHEHWSDDDVYVTFQPSNHTPVTLASCWKRWCAKWSKRTALRAATIPS